jgi:adenosylhomocysteine nucleosidase
VPTVTSDVRATRAPTLLVVAAERFELKYVRPAQGQVWILRANGPGFRLAGAVADETGPNVDAVLNVGLCGALNDKLQVGDIVVGTAVNGVTVNVPDVSGVFHAGAIASVDRVAQTAAEKRRLSDTGAIAVEMEAAALLERARRWGVPFYCVRAVSDTADEDFALDFNAARDREGRFQPVRIVAQALRRPLTGIPELLRLRRNAEKAAKALGEFLGNCRF